MPTFYLTQEGLRCQHDDGHIELVCSNRGFAQNDLAMEDCIARFNKSEVERLWPYRKRWGARVWIGLLVVITLVIWGIGIYQAVNP